MFKKLSDRLIFLSRSQYCNQYGHKIRERKNQYYRYPSTVNKYVYVADSIKVEEKYCPRCNEYTEQTVISEKGLTGLNMPKHKWEELVRKGKIPC